MDSREKLTELFIKFPGIGRRQAKRFVYFLLSRNKNFSEVLRGAIGELHDEIVRCGRCMRYFRKMNADSTDKNICNICSDAGRDKSLLMVVEKDIDFENIRKSGKYDGLYFIIGGSLPILEKNPTEKIRIKELVELVKKESSEGLKEIILAFSANPEGENTSQYIKKTLEPLQEKKGIKISSLGRGLSTGTELEYSDEDTLKHALKNRS